MQKDECDLWGRSKDCYGQQLCETQPEKDSNHGK